MKVLINGIGTINNAQLPTSGIANKDFYGFRASVARKNI